MSPSSQGSRSVCHDRARRFPVRVTPVGGERFSAVLASAAGHREFAHTGAWDGNEVDLGGLLVVGS
jgi:hypothetical protein